VNIIYKKMPLANAGADLVIAQYDSVQLNASTHPDNLAYLWTPAGSLNNAMIRNPVATPSIATLYTVRVTSVDGCILEDAVMVNIQFPMHAPNAFSPNGDNINDKWRVTNLEFNPKARVHVYDRYGRLVFLSQGTSAQWDGTNKGKPMPPATYYYIIDVGNGEKLTGWVLLVR
jgi:gliding motility-associated-like protein